MLVLADEPDERFGRDEQQNALCISQHQRTSALMSERDKRRIAQMKARWMVKNNKKSRGLLIGGSERGSL
jgi:hypothetical protein